MKRLLTMMAIAVTVAGCAPASSAEVAELNDKLDAINEKLVVMEERAEAAEARNAEMAATIKLLDRKMKLGF